MEMTKAYDVQVLIADAKDIGLEIGEDVAVKLLDVVYNWFEKSANLSSTPFDDMAVPFVEKGMLFAKLYADKIDGKIGN